MMKEYDIYVPMNYNDGLPVEKWKLDDVKVDLLAEFHGLSVSPGPVRGYWQSGNQVHEDYNFIYKVVCDDSVGTRSMILKLKAKLESMLRQKQIFIIVRDVEVM